MLSVYNLKPQFQKMLSPILRFFYNNNITANQITITALILSLTISILFFFSDTNKWLLLSLPVGLFLRMALNALDGMMARTYNQTTNLGEVLNELGDVVSDFIIFLPLIKFLPEAIYPIIIFMVMSVVNEFAGILGKVISGVRHYEGPMGKSDRALLIGVLGIVLLCGMDISHYSIIIFAIANILLIISTYTRIRKTLNESNKQ